MHRAVPLPLAASGRCPAALRERWRLATLAAGWPFPSDWGVPAVDAVCEAMLRGQDFVEALTTLGAARATSGASLEETLRDLAALCSVGTVAPGAAHAAASDPVELRPGGDEVDRLPTWVVRAAALGWADAAAGELVAARPVDELTGLATAGYLRVRLGEVYRGARACGVAVEASHVLVPLALDLSRTGGWTRLVPMLMAAEAMRVVFDSGESLALAGPSVAVVLARRDERLDLRIARLRRLATELLDADAEAACAGPARVWVERLPADYDQACDLLVQLGR